jgi:excisionase family DNA binding protein
MQTESAQSALLTPAQAAKYLEVAEDTLSVWRCVGRYNLPYVKVGTRVRYRKEDLDAWITKRRRGAEAGEGEP